MFAVLVLAPSATSGASPHTIMAFTFSNDKKRSRFEISMVDDEADLQVARARRLAAWKLQQGIDVAPEPSVEVMDEVDPLDAFMVNVNAAAQNDKLSALLKEQQIMHEHSQSEGSTTSNSLEGAPRASDVKVADQIPALFPPQMPASPLDDAPVTKNLWIEVPELTKLTDEQVADLRKYQLDDMRVKGKSVPKPIMNWAQSGLPTVFIDLMKSQHYSKPTPVQSQVRLSSS
jgi:ATP-dependent RNA helicase DDX46/PRP5